MKKFLLIVICCLCLCGCGNDSKNKELLIGKWSYFNGEFSWDKTYSHFTFNKNNTFDYSICFYGMFDKDCDNGYAKWNGTYSLDGNRLKLNISEEEQITLRFGYTILDPPLDLIIDFDNMYICDGNDGLDCDKKYEKDS